MSALISLSHITTAIYALKQIKQSSHRYRQTEKQGQ